MNAAKRKGTAWESKVVEFLQGHGWVNAERRALAGQADKGDVVGLPGVVIEAKSQARHSIAEWLDEATVERDNAHARIGVAWFKRRGKTDPGKGYVLMDGDTFALLLKEAGW